MGSKFYYLEKKIRQKNSFIFKRYMPTSLLLPLLQSPHYMEHVVYVSFTFKNLYVLSVLQYFFSVIIYIFLGHKTPGFSPVFQK